MRILVTGGLGTVGRCLTEQLRKRGHHAFCRGCVFVNYKLFGEYIDFNKQFERTWCYWLGKYGRNPKRFGKALSEKANNLYKRLNIRH